ncbi:MAG: hypothetical protein KDK97_05515, partial [Verrucomicrobiales bacterium]|nr:hypothetical protein [Verrucomicrobiales bacterium]
MTARTFTRAEIAAAAGCTKENVRLRMKHAPAVPGSSPLAYHLADILPEWRDACAASRPDAEEATPAAEPTEHRILTGPHAERAQARLWVLMAFEDWRAERGGPVMEAMRGFCQAYNAGTIEAPAEIRGQIRTVAWNTLQRWRNARTKDGLQGLSGRNWGGDRRTTIDADEELRDFILAHIAARPTHIKVVHIDQAMRVRFDAERCPSYGALKRWVKAWRDDNARLLSLWSNPDSHRGRYRPAFGHADADVT